MATQVQVNAVDWILAEKERGTNPADIISAITILASGLSSGLLVLTSSGSEGYQKTVVRLFEELLRADIARAQESLK